MKSFLSGFIEYFRGLRVWISQGSMIRISLIPIVIHFLFFLGSSYYVIQESPKLLDYFGGGQERVLKIIFFIVLKFLLVLGLVILAFFVSYLFSVILAFPLNSLLAERVLATTPTDRGSWKKRMWANTSALTKRLLIYLIATIFFSLLTFIPFLNPLAALGAITLIAWDKLDYSFDYFGWPLASRYKFAREHVLELAGFTFGLGLTSLIPIINVLVQPGAVVSAALLTQKLVKRSPL